MQKQTKIVATVSNHRSSLAFLRELEAEGVNVVRLNSAHQTPDEMRAMVRMIHEASPSLGVLVDTKGPEIRTSRYGETIQAQTGTPILVYGDPNGESHENVLYVNSEKLVEATPLGSSILIDDGDLELVVTGKENEFLTCFPQSDGEIKNRKSVNVPNVHIDLPSLSERDKQFLKVAAEENVDFIAHSFVRTRQDVMDVQHYLNELKCHARIIAKIENQQGVDNIDQILDHAYGIMVARGDLGIEIPGERVPEVQRMIVHKCIESKKPVIIATQMLHSMIENPRPTRAEISDVASAIYQRTDAIMLSGETATGKYPIEAVRTMTRIAQEVEGHLPTAPDQLLHRVQNPLTETLARAAIRACDELPIKAVICDTLSGRTARYLSAFRGHLPIYAMCYNSEVRRRLALSYGVEATYIEMYSSREIFMVESLKYVLETGHFSPSDLVLIVGGSFDSQVGASFMEICQAKKMLNRPLSL